jgi:DNA-binding Lrp family transcriptional regulator
MADLDDTDLEILNALMADARRAYSDIGEEVGLSGPAVSARVERLREAGVVRGFTLDIDRSALDSGVPVLVKLDPEDREVARGTAEESDAVEGVLAAADGTLRFLLHAEPGGVHAWLDERFDGDVSVTLLDDATWTPALAADGFALTCAECENTVGPGGETVTLDGERYRFCCSSCRERFVDRYERFEEET